MMIMNCLNITDVKPEDIDDEAPLFGGGNALTLDSVDALQLGAKVPLWQGRHGPPRSDPLAGVELNLEGTLAEKVTQLLEQSINPSLASHGGFATLLGVEDGVVGLE